MHAFFMINADHAMPITSYGPQFVLEIEPPTVHVSEKYRECPEFNQLQTFALLYWGVPDSFSTEKTTQSEKDSKSSNLLNYLQVLQSLNPRWVDRLIWPWFRVPGTIAKLFHTIWCRSWEFDGIKNEVEKWLRTNPILLKSFVRIPFDEFFEDS